MSSLKNFSQISLSLETLILGKLGKIPLERLILPAISVNFDELLTVVESINGFKWKES